MPGMPEPAWKTHADGEDPRVRQRLEGCLALGGRILSLKELKVACKNAADEGNDPCASGIVELGMLLPEPDYEALLGYVKGLSVVRPKVRRKRA